MNIVIANRLVELRKKNGYSQEELANKLGLSRQAVSKWERAEASPDTDNLICLAKLYNVSLDELLGSDESVEEIALETKEREEEKTVSKEETKSATEEKKVEKDPFKRVTDIVAGITAPVILLAYIILGLTLPDNQGWFVYWVLFLLIPVIPSLMQAIHRRKFCDFLYPVLITAIYCFLGLEFDLWHPYWVLFLTIPVYYAVFAPIDNLLKKKEEKEQN